MLKVENIQKNFGKVSVLKNISFQMKKGEFLSILGPSGSGKTTLLRIIAGLERADSGRILIDGQEMTEIPVAQRNLGMVFQNYSLFPSMTAYQNIVYALKNRKTFRNRRDFKAECSDLVEEIIHRCELEDVLDRYPSQLSGGQQQRIAIARAMVMSPRLMLFDEPFSALDVSLRNSLRSLLKSFQKDYHMTMLYVTHDQEEAFLLSDKILVIQSGIIQQLGSPEEILQSPANEFVDVFTKKNLLERFADISSIIKTVKKDQV